MEENKKQFKMFGDYHTHTMFSHGKNSVLENAFAAKEAGLSEIGICEHGPCHYHGVSEARFKELASECKEVERETGIKVLVGIESNVIDFDGTADFEPVLNDVDFVALGMHCLVKTKFKVMWQLAVRRKLFPNTKRQREFNTKIMINAIEKNAKYLDFFSHPDRRFPCDLVRIAEVMAKNNVAFELNTNSLCLTETELKQIASTGVKFIVGSDAHVKNRVGEVTELANNLVALVPENQIIKKLEPKLSKLKTAEK